MTWRLGYFSLMYLIMLIWKMEFPWEESWNREEVLVRRGWQHPLPPHPASTAAHQNDYVHTSLGQQVQAVLVIFVSANGCSTQQLLLGIFGGQWIIPVLLQVCSGNDGHQLIIFIYNGQLS